MSRRVVLDASGLKIAKPGFNADTTGPGNLNFSSDWSAFGVVDQDTFTFSFPSSNGSTTENIPLGQTFPSPPFVIFEHIVNGQYRRATPNRFLFERRARIFVQQGGSWLYANTASYSIQLTVTTSAIVVSANWNRANRPLTIPDFTFRWTLFTYNY